MSEQFVKLHMWMAKTGLNPSELIIFAVIHSFTESGGSYFGGISTLKEWTGCGERTVQNALKHLVSEGWVIVKRESRGRFSSEYVTNPAKIAGLKEAIPAEIAPLPRRNCTVNPAESAPNKIIDKINIEIVNNKETHKELTDILTTASLNLPQFAGQEVEMRERMQEMWEAAEMNLFGERLSNREIRRLIRTLDRDKAFDLCVRIKRAEVRGMIEDREYKKEYWYSTIYNKLRESREPYKDSIEELRI